MDLHIAHVSMERSVFAGGEAERRRGIQIPGGDGRVFGFGHGFAIDKEAQGIARSDGGDMVPAGGERLVPRYLAAGGPGPDFS